MGLAACKSLGSGARQVMASLGEVTKLGKFTIMCDNTVVTESNGVQDFYSQLEEATDLDIEWTRLDHSGYYDAVFNAFNSDDTMLDVVLL